MTELVANCPRCGTKKITFTVLADFVIERQHGWQRIYEVFAKCGHCDLGTTFIAQQRSYEHGPILDSQQLVGLGGEISWIIEVKRFVSIRDLWTIQPPDHAPAQIAAVFREAATCVAVNCWNAAGTMFRLCVDLATLGLLPEGDAEGLNAKVRRDLGLRLPWLFKNGKLPEALHELASSIKEDGNDGAHWASLNESDAQDLLDFTTALLTRLYTEPKQLELAMQRRQERREKK